jgi:hypothetical protein
VPPCPGLRPDEWAETHRRCAALINRWGAQADARDAAITAYLADPSKPVVLAYGWAAEELVLRDAIRARRLNAIKARRREAVRNAILLAPVG